jgi:hypothetical protein
LGIAHEGVFTLIFQAMMGLVLGVLTVMGVVGLIVGVATLACNIANHNERKQ